MKESTLLVEGNNDLHVVKALCNKFSIEETFDVIDKKSIEKLLEAIPAEINRLIRPGRNCLGIMVDADQNMLHRWNQITRILSDKGYHVPDNPDVQGTIISHPALGMPVVGVWLMSNNLDIGMIEDFISILVPDDDKSFSFAEETLTALEKQSLHKYRKIHRAKALIHTWLAWQEDPGTPLGLAITKSYLTANKDLCQQFVDWLDRLFNQKGL